MAEKGADVRLPKQVLASSFPWVSRPQTLCDFRTAKQAAKITRNDDAGCEDLSSAL
jgi:hypothetical protein